MKKYLLLIGALMLIPNFVYASGDATINIEASKNKVSVGNTITATVSISSTTPIGYYEYTLDYNSNKLELLKGSPYYVNKINNDETKKTSKSFSFKVIDDGSSKITVKSYVVKSYLEKDMNVNVNPVTISTNGSSSSYLNTNNYLSSLTVDGYKISPTFNKKTNNYKLELEKDVKKINIVAKPENSKSKITGDGEFEIVPGDNKFEISVTSESGDERIYTILVTVNDLDPINIEVDGKTYTIVKNVDTLKIPDNYKKVKIKIDEQEVGALYNEVTKLTLVGLKDKDGDINLYIYDNDTNTYSLYNELLFEKIAFLPIKTEEKLKGYELYNETINNIDIECYKISSNSNYSIIYGMNLISGEKGWYSYDKSENTLQRYNDEFKDYYKDDVKNNKILIYILSGTTLIFGITIIVLAIKRKNK